MLLANNLQHVNSTPKHHSHVLCFHEAFRDASRNDTPRAYVNETSPPRTSPTWFARPSKSYFQN